MIPGDQGGGGYQYQLVNRAGERGKGWQLDERIPHPKSKRTGETRMKLKWICGVLFAIALTIPSSAQISVYIGSAPPPLRYEQRGPIPGPGFVWIEGYWAPDGHHYRWVAGHWERPPYEGAYWSHPHYDHYREGWRWHEGHWDREDHDRDRGHDDDHHDH